MFVMPARLIESSSCVTGESVLSTIKLPAATLNVVALAVPGRLMNRLVIVVPVMSTGSRPV
jgi:hypothetical protein